MGRVLLVQLDGKLPNIALMRIAAHHANLGDEVVLRRGGERGLFSWLEWAAARYRPEKLGVSEGPLFEVLQ